MCQYTGKWHIRLVYESKPLITVETAISSSIYMTFRSDEKQMRKTGRPPHSSRFFFSLVDQHAVTSDKSSLRWELVGWYLTMLDLKMAFRALSDGVRWTQQVFWFSHAPHPMRKRHENHVSKRVLLNGGDRTVVEQETPEKAFAGLDARKPIGYRAVAVSFTLITRLIMPICVTFGCNWGARCCPACLQRPLPPILNFLDPCLAPDDYQRDLAMIIGVEKKKLSLENAHLRTIVTVWRLSHCFFGTFECWQSSLQLVWSERCSTKYRERRIAFWNNIEYLRQPCVS